MPPSPIAFHTYQSRFLPVSAQRLLNLYAEKQPEGTRGPLALFGTPGLRAFSDVPGGAVHHLVPFKGSVLAYAGTSLSSIASDGSATLIGTIPGSGKSYFAITGDFVTFVRDGKGWTYGTPTYSFNTSAYDSIVPSLIGSTPANGGTDVQTTADIILGFDKNVSLGTGTMQVFRGDTNALVATIAAGDCFTVEKTIQCPTGVTLDGDVEYYVLASDGFVTDTGGARWVGITSNQDLRFTTTSTADDAAPVLQSATPSGGTEVASGTSVYFYFDERILPNVGNVTVTNLNTGGVQSIPVTSCTYIRSILQVPANTIAGQTYQVSIPANGISDLLGNLFGGTSLLFSTYASDGRPKVQSITLDGPRGPLVLEFDRAMSVGSGTIQLRKKGGTYTIDCTAVASGPRVTISFANTETGQDYDLLIPPGTLRALSGSYLDFPGFGTAQLLQIVDGDFLPPSTVTSLDGYTIFTRAGDSGEWFISELGEPQQFDALDFATAESSPDPLVRAFVDHRELWLFGTQSTEIWYNSGDTEFPFSRVSGANLEKGCVSPESVAKTDNRVFWIGQDASTGAPTVYVAEGYSPRVISTPPISRWLQDGTAADATCFAYTQEGHTFYVVHIPPGDYPFWRTVVYDAGEGIWHERQSGVEPGRWRANCYLYAYGRHLVGDWQNGMVYELSLDAYDEAGDVMIAEAIGVYNQGDGQRFVTSRVEAIMDVGVGLNTGQGSAPEIMLSWSDDGGRTWSGEHWRPMGAIGEYATRVRWHNLGQARAGYRTYKFRISDPVKRAIIGAYTDVQIGKR